MNTTIVTVVFSLVYYTLAILFLRGIRFTTKDICVCGIIIALTMILDSIYVPLPTGATVSLCGSLPLMLMAILWDKRLAMMSGLVCGVLAIFLIPGWQPVHWGQIFVEHMVCFSCLGFAGVFGNKNRLRITCGLLLSILIKLIGHVLSGALFFSQNAWDGWGAWGYSLAYNISGTVPISLVCVAIILVLPLKSIGHAIGKEVAQ